METLGPEPNHWHIPRFIADRCSKKAGCSAGLKFYTVLYSLKSSHTISLLNWLEPSSSILRTNSPSPSISTLIVRPSILSALAFHGLCPSLFCSGFVQPSVGRAPEIIGSSKKFGFFWCMYCTTFGSWELKPPCCLLLSSCW